MLVTGLRLPSSIRTPPARQMPAAVVAAVLSTQQGAQQTPEGGLGLLTSAIFT